MPSLTKRQERFIKEYLIDSNGTQAAIRAGYSESNARQQASYLLTKPNILMIITERKKELETTLDITAERIRSELAKIAFSNIFDLIDKNGRIRENVNKDNLSAINKYRFSQFERNGKVETAFEIILHDKLKAIELLAKLMGYFDKNAFADDSETGVVLLPAIMLQESS
jgi:phage terminase small subunit